MVEGGLVIGLSVSAVPGRVLSARLVCARSHRLYAAMVPYVFCCINQPVESGFVIR